jgi:hypothetical protein
MPLASTTTEFWQWNGVSLNMPMWNLTTWGGSRQDAPTLRGQNYVVAYRAGQMWRAKMPDQRTLSMAMWAAGIDQNTGLPAADQRLAFNSNFQQLRSMFWAQGVGGSAQGALTRRWYVTQGGSPVVVAATAQAEVAGTMQPVMTGRTRADFTVDLLLADPYFYGAQQTQSLAYNSPANVTNLGDGAIGFGQPSVTSGVNFTIQLNGPLTSPKLTNSTAGVSVTASYTIAAGHSCLLDVLNYTAVDDASASHIGVVSHTGARPWMILLPGTNVMQLTSANGGDTGSALLTWSPPYL